MSDRVAEAVTVEDVVAVAKLFGGLGAAEGSMMGRRGKTTPADIAKTERLCAVLDLRFRGHTFAQIAAMQVPPVTAQAVHKAFWKTMRAHPFDDRARRRRQRANRDSLIT